MQNHTTIQHAAQRPQDQEAQPQGGNDCQHCLGKGRVPTRRGTGKRQRTKTCMYCRGTGKTVGGGGYLTK